MATQRRGIYLCLYVVIDLFSRHVVVWMLSRKENSALAQQLSDNESSGVEIFPVDKDNPPTHPDFTPDKKNKEKIPWNKNKKGFKDKKGNYWEPVPDGHKGTHEPHWDVQHPDKSHTPVYPPK